MVINVVLRLNKVMSHLNLDFYTIITWNMLIVKVFLVIGLGLKYASRLG
jgi:hypothetical protein